MDGSHEMDYFPFFLSFFFEMKNLKKAKEKVAFNVGSMYIATYMILTYFK